MSRDPEILTSFEKTDDAIHGVWAYYAFAAATFSSSKDSDILNKLPNTHTMTYDWDRGYSTPALVSELRRIFPHYHTRMCVIAIAGLFETVLGEFWTRVDQCGVTQQKGRNPDYKPRLDWAFDRLSKTTYGTPGMRSRVDQNRRDVDDARRLRNCFLHNNGLFNERYEKDAIPIKGSSGLHPDYQRWKSSQSTKVSIILGPADFDKYYKGHLELLHQLHDVIQREDFGLTGPGYSYKQEGKTIDWSRALTGV